MSEQVNVPEQNQTEVKQENPKQEQPKLFTIEDIAKSVVAFDICPLNTPIQFGGMTINCAKRTRKALVLDRIEAVRFSKEQYGMEFNDAITSYIASNILVFGEYINEQRNEKGALTQLEMKGEVTLPVDMLINNPYEELVNLAHLMGKS